MLPTPPPSPQLKGYSSATDSVLHHVLPGTSIRLQRVLGIGAYGTVYVAQDAMTGVDYAVKALNKIGLTARQASFLEQEISLHRRASSHPNIVTLVDVVDTIDTTFVILEYCPEGDLFGNITEHSRYVGNDAVAKSIFLQLLDAVEYCHSIGIYHRDLKPENILITDGGRTIKLADFGLACTDSCSSDFGCGSTFYMSPECLQSPVAFGCYSSAANDVWSLGICLVNLTCGRNPWKRASVSDPTFAAYLQDSAFLPTILPLSHDLDWILRRIFECEPQRRVTIPQLRHMILQCPSFTTTVPSKSTSFVEQRPAYVPCYDLPPSPQPDYDAAAFNAHFSDLANSPDSIASDDDWMYHRSISPISLSPMPTSPMYNGYASLVASPPTIDCAQNYSSAASAAANWYSGFMLPALDLAQKHLSIHPTFFPGLRFA